MSSRESDCEEEEVPGDVLSSGGAPGQRGHAHSTAPQQGTTVGIPSINVSPPTALDLRSSSVAEDWYLWIQLFRNYLELSGMDQRSESFKVKLFESCIGIDGLRIVNSLRFSTSESRHVLDDVTNKFEKIIVGEQKEFFQRFQFNRREQGLDESIEQYMAALRNMAKSCGFCDCMHDKLLMDRLIMGVRDDKTREKLISQRRLDLQSAIDICTAMEVASTQMKAVRESAEVVHSVNVGKNHNNARYSKRVGNDVRKAQEWHDQKYKINKFSVKERRPSSHRYTAKTVTVCKFCCKTHELIKEKCPAWGRLCNSCGLRNHFSASCVCTTRVYAMYEDRDKEFPVSDTELVSCVETIHALPHKQKGIYCKMLINGEPIKMQVDCGATVSVLPVKYIGAAHVLKEKVSLRMWDKSTKKALGRCVIRTMNPRTGLEYDIRYVIVDDETSLMPLLGARSAVKMGLITINDDNFESINVVKQHIDWYTEFPTVFHGNLGSLPGGPVHLKISGDADCAVRPARRIPEAMKQEAKKALDKLRHEGKIVPVDEPTDWVNQMCLTKKKSGDLRVCIDPRPLNVALKREYYKLPVIEDILPDLNGATLFSICDLEAGYHHCELDYESSLLTTFATPFGRYRWLRLPFGLKVSSEIFQKRLHQALEGLQGVQCVADDVLVYGEETNHDERMRKFLARCARVGIRLNQKKCQFCMPEVDFMGHVVTSEGLGLDPKKVEAITKMEPPRDKDDVQRLVGMVNYLSKFLPNLATVLRPIVCLVGKNVEWKWGNAEAKAFQEIKSLLTKAPVLRYFDSSKQLVIQSDASSKGIGAVLLQEDHPLCYTSRALTDTESRYAIIEKEMLAIVNALEKWHQFTYGRPIIVYTDHKPLESIVLKPLDKAPKRLQAMLIRALAYDIEVRYMKGNQMFIADTLSRAYLPVQNGDSDEEFEKIDAVTFLTMAGDRIDLVRQETKRDNTLQTLKSVIQQGWPEKKSHLPGVVTPYFDMRDELSYEDGLIFRGERLVIPKQLRPEIKKDIHVGHVGIEGCLRRARESVYWPNMNAEIKSLVQCCEACRSYEISPPNETLMSHELPNRPWKKIGIDLFELNGKYYLITVCYFSNFWEIDRLYDTTAQSVVIKIKAHCARYGIPDEMISDNGPQMISETMSKFTSRWGIGHKTISPYNSKANGKVESAVKSAKNMLRKTEHNGEDQYLALLNIRNTPTQGTTTSPVQRMMCRRTKTNVPIVENLLKPDSKVGENEVDRLKCLQNKQASYYNVKAHDRPELCEGDTVRLKPFRRGVKRWKKGTVTKQLDARSYEVETEDGEILRRNRCHMRRSYESPVRIMPGDPLTDVAEGIPDQVVSGEDKASGDDNVKDEGLHDYVQKQEYHVSNPSTPVMNDNVLKTRSGRCVKPPKRFSDYVTDY